VTASSLLSRLRAAGALSPALQDLLARDGIVTRADLELAVAESHRAGRDLLAPAAAAVAADEPSLTLGRAWDVLEALLTDIAAHCPDIEGVEVSGEVRRFEPLLHGLVLVARAPDPPSAIGSLANVPTIASIVHRTGRRMAVMYRGHEVDIRIAAPDDYGSVLFATTGPAAHVAEVLRRRGPRLSANERDVYGQAGLGYVPPELRDAPDAFDMARRGAVPELVARTDIRGDLHMHTSYSDGRDTVREMVATCCAHGYEYIAITDHSEHAAASRTVTLDHLARQAEEVERAREEFPQIAILHGLEADILPDGSIDCPDRVLASLDIVLASLHEDAGHSRARLTERCLRAIRHPLVSVITHPMNQLVGRRPGYDMDYDAIYAAAAESGTALEVDGGPGHLDLDGEHARAAIAAGVTLTVDSDCHRARSLERQMRLAVGTARRGSVEPRHVLNTRPLADVRAFLARKRGR
jgi:DNA polymerase (family 10)